MKPTSFFRWPVSLGLSAAVVLLLGSLGSAQPPAPSGPGGGPGAPGGPPPGPTAAPPGPKPEIIAFSGTQDRWAWLRRNGDTVELFHGTPTGSKTLLAQGPGWKDVVLVGDTAWVLQNEAGRGALLSAPLGTPGTPKVELTGLSNPESLFAEGERLFWLERTASRPEGPTFIPAAASRLRLVVRESGSSRVLAEWPAVAVPTSSALSQASGTRVVGLGDGSLFVQETGLTSTLINKIPEAGGEPKRVVAVSGMQQALVHNSDLYWTAPSEEASNYHATACIRRLRPGGEPETLTDWLRLPVSLLRHQGSVRAATHALYRIPERLAPAELADATALVPGETTSDGAHIILLHEADGPLLVR